LLKKLGKETFRGDTENIILTPHYISRSEISDKIREIRCRTDIFKYSFFSRTIGEHNKIKVPIEGNTYTKLGYGEISNVFTELKLGISEHGWRPNIPCHTPSWPLARYYEDVDIPRKTGRLQVVGIEKV
jgi:hypothetical protein